MIDMLRKEKSVLETQLSKVEKEFGEYKVSEAEIKSRLDALTQELENERGRHEIEKSLVATEAQEAASKAYLEKMRLFEEKLIASQREINDATNRLDDVKKENEELKKSLKEKQEKLDQLVFMSVSFADSSSDVDVLRQEIGRLKKELEATVDSEVRAINAVNEIEEERNELIKKLLTFESHSDKKNKESVLEIDKRIDEKRKELENLKLEKGTLIETITSETELLKQTVMKLRDETNRERNELERLKSEQINLTEKKKAQEKEVSELESNLLSLRRERERLEAVIQSARDSYAAADKPVDSVALLPQEKKVEDIAEPRIFMGAKIPAESSSGEYKVEFDELEEMIERAYKLEDDGNSNGAMNMWEKILEKDSSNIKAIHNLALLRFRSVDFDGAVRLIDDAKKRGVALPRETKKLFSAIEDKLGRKNIFGFLKK